MSGWSAALRIARREARRAKGRSALVVALIGLPALALTFTAVSYDMFALTTEERLDRDLGATDAELAWWGGPLEQQDVRGWAVDQPTASEEPPPPPTEARLRELLPTIEQVLPMREGSTRMRTANGVGTLGAEGLDLADPGLHAVAPVIAGEPPAGPGEVALTADAMTRLGAGIGDRVTLADREPDQPSSYTVTGEVEFPDGLNNQTVVFHPDGWPADDSPTRWLVVTSEPVTRDQVTTLNAQGLTAYSRAVALDPPPGVTDSSTGDVNGEVLGVGVLVAGLAVLEIVLLAGPAFAVGARRRRRELALVAVGGGTPAQLRRIVLADGAVLGLVGAGAGLLLGIAAGFAARPLSEEFLMGTRAGGYRVFPEALVAIAAIAIVTGVLAALVPATTAARAPVVASLAGHRGSGRARRRWLVLGLALVVAGAGITGAGAWRVSAAVMLAGLVVSQLGLVLCTPTIVGLVARLGRGLPLAPRIALRDTARNRSAAAPAISAVMAAVAGAAAAGVVLVNQDVQSHVGTAYPPGTAYIEGGWNWQEEPPDEAALTAAIDQMVRGARATLPVDEAHQVHWPACPSDSEEFGCRVSAVVPPDKHCPFWDVPQLSSADQRAARSDPRCDHASHPHSDVRVAPDARALAALTGADPAAVAAGVAVLREGGVVVTDEQLLSDGTVTLQLLTYQEESEEVAASARLPGRMVPVDHRGFAPLVIASPAAIGELGLDAQPGPVLLSTTRMPTQAEEDAFALAMEELGGYGFVSREDGGSDLDPMLVVLAAAAGLIALGAAAIATGLAATDRRPDLATLGAVGASPRVRRSLSLSQSGVIAGLGTVLGLVAGLGAAIAVLVALNQRYASTWPAPEPYPITVPWLPVVALLAVPLVAMLGAGLLTRSRLPIERRTT